MRFDLDWHSARAERPTTTIGSGRHTNTRGPRPAQNPVTSRSSSRSASTRRSVEGCVLNSLPTIPDLIGIMKKAFISTITHPRMRAIRPNLSNSRPATTTSFGTSTSKRSHISPRIRSSKRIDTGRYRHTVGCMSFTILVHSGWRESSYRYSRQYDFPDRRARNDACSPERRIADLGAGQCPFGPILTRSAIPRCTSGSPSGCSTLLAVLVAWNLVRGSGRGPSTPCRRVRYFRRAG